MRRREGHKASWKAAGLGVIAATGVLACNALIGNDSPPEKRPIVPVEAGESHAPKVDVTHAPDADLTDAKSAPTECNTDLSSDRDNCGACGHSCLGGACEGGRCRPMRLAHGQYKPTGVAVEPGSDGYVFWTCYGLGTSGAVRRTGKDGQSGITDIDLGARRDPHYRPFDVLLRNGRVYWTSVNNNDGAFGRVYWATRDATDLGSTSVAWNGPWGLAADTFGVFFTNRWDKNVVVRFAFGTTPQTVVQISELPPDYGAFGITADTGKDGFVYYGDSYGVYRVSKDGGTPTTVSSLPGGILASDANYVFFVNDSGIYRFPKSSPTQVMQIGTDNLSPIRGIAVDDGTLYVTANDKLMRMKIDGSDLELLYASKDSYLYNIAVDRSAIYFTAQNDGDVLRLAK